MKLSASYLVSASLVGLVACVMIGLTGCEEAKGLEGLSLSFSSDEVTKPGDTVVIQVVGERTTATTEQTQTEGNTTTYTRESSVTYDYNELALPFEWKVADPALGSLLVVDTGTAVYTARAVSGPNVVTVKDQYDNVGRLVIRVASSDYGLELTAAPGTTIEIGAAVTIGIDSADAIGPFTWRKVSGPGTVSGGAGGSRSAAYSSTVSGTGVIEVTDGNGVQGIIAIVVQDSSSGDGGGSGGPGGS